MSPSQDRLAARHGDAVINDSPGLLLIVEKQAEGNTLMSRIGSSKP